MGALALVVSTALVARLVRDRLAVAWFAVAMAATLVSGRLTFALGVAAGAGAVLLAARGRPWLAGLGGVVTAVASPVAGLFAAVVGGALLVARGRGAARAAVPERAAPAGAALAAGSLAPIVLLAVLFGDGGTFPFATSAFLPAFAAGAAVAAVARAPALRWAGGLYALLCLAAYVLPTAVGGNAARLGPLLAGTVAVVLLRDRRPLVLAALALPILYWQAQPAVRDWNRAHDDPSVQAAFHRPLATWLAAQPGPVRVEVPLTQGHGEARHLAPVVPIARGWERQTDRARNPLFYDGELTPERYLRWLRDNAVTHVAVAAIPYDAAGEREAALVPRMLPFVAEVGSWRVHRVRGPRPLAEGAARLERLDPEGFVLTGRQPGTTLVRLRFSPYWAVLGGEGCVERGPGGWTRVRTRAPGTVTVGTRFSPGRAGATGRRCS